MSRPVRILVGVVLVLGWAQTVAAGEIDERQVTRRYGCETHATGATCQNVFKIPTRATETTVSIDVADDTGLPALARVGQNLDGDRRLERRRTFCNSIEDLEIVGGKPLEIVVVHSIIINGESPCGAVALSAMGTITIMLEP